jgi:hypothetical protein
MWPKTPRRGYFLFRDAPCFLVFVKENWLDLLSCLLCNLFALLFVFVIPLPFQRYRVFPITQPNGLHTTDERASSVADQHIAYPYFPEIIDTVQSALISWAIPSTIIVLISVWRIGSFQDCNSAVGLHSLLHGKTTARVDIVDLRTHPY